MNLKYKIKSTSFAKALKRMCFRGWPPEGESKLHIVLAPTKEQQKNRKKQPHKGG
jgi:hypothetical protein